MLSNYEKAVELIMLNKNLVDLDFYHCSEEVISQVKSLLNIQLPNSYIKFLKDIGYLSFGCISILGIRSNDLPKSAIIDWTLDERNNWGMPKDLVIIEDEGLDGESYCLQINEEDPDKSPIVAYVHPDVPIEVLAPDFGTYLLQRVQWAIQVHKEDLEEEKQKESAKAPQEKMVQDELF